MLLTADGQQTDAAQSSSVQPKPDAPPIIQLNEHERVDTQNQMKLMNPVQEHSAPVPMAPGFPLPEMVTDSDGNLKIARARENFASLSLGGSDLQAQEPVFGSREERPTFIRELWQVRWRPNDPIDLYIILPRNVQKPPAVLYLYGFPSDTDRFKNDGYCQRVTQSGVAAIGFVSALTGQRYAYRPFKNWFVSELPESIASTVHDVQMILNQLRTRQDLDLTRMGIYGQGSGATIAILAAAVDSRLKAVDLLDPWGDWPEWFAKANEFTEEERATYLMPDFLKKLQPLEPLNYLPALKNRKLRIQFVQGNGEPVEVVKKLEAAVPTNAEVRHFRTGHDMFEAYSGGRLFSWVAERLEASGGSEGQAEASGNKDLRKATPAQN